MPHSKGGKCLVNREKSRVTIALQYQGQKHEGHTEPGTYAEIGR